MSQIEKLQMGDETALQEKFPGKAIPATLIEESIETKDFTSDWTLHYKAVHNVGSLNFKGPVDKEKAFKLGNQFCAARNWRFIQVRPMYTDIMSLPQSEEERNKYR